MKTGMLLLFMIALVSGCAAPAEEGAVSADASVSGPSTAPEPSSAASAEATGADPSALASGAYGPVWEMDPAAAFEDPASCENLAGAPTMEQGENVAWRISYPGDWSSQEAYLGECMWFGPEPWESDLETATPPDEVAIVISVLDGRVTPGSPEFEGGTVADEEEFTVAGAPAVRYDIAGSDGEFLVGDGVIWVIGVQGELPDFDAVSIPMYLVAYTSSEDAAALEENADVLDRMVATLEIVEP